MSRRIGWIDNSKAIGIILVYIGHVIATSSFPCFLIYSFHMPLFFIISGYLVRGNKETCVGDVCKRKVVSLGIPYVVFSLFNYLLIKIFSISSPGALGVLLYGWGRNPLWFLPMLLIIGILWAFVMSDSKPMRYFSIALVLALLIVRVITHNRWLPYSLNELPFYFTCFALGDVLKPTINKLLISPRFPFTCFLCPLWVVGVFFVFSQFPDYRLAGDLGSFGLRMILGLIGTAFVFSAAKFLDKVWQPVRAILLWVGRNTLVILCVHWIYYAILSSYGLPLTVVHLLNLALIALTIVTYNKITVLK